MIHLAQLYKLVDDKKLFVTLFTDFDSECKELEYTGSEGELFNEMLLNHFGLEIESDIQLYRIVKSLNNRTLNTLQFIV